MAPLKTFLNLPPDRQQEIITVSLEEFALHGYKNASLDRIFSKLAITKGAFYRYFKSKKSLYEYLFAYSRDKTFAHFEKIFLEPCDNLFDSWVDHYLETARLDRQYPLCSALLFSLIFERDHELYGNMLIHVKKREVAVFKERFMELQKKKKIKKHINLNVLSYVFCLFHLGIYDFLVVHYNINVIENIKKKKPLFDIPEEQFKKDLEAFIRILLDGIGNMNTGRNTN